MEKYNYQKQIGIKNYNNKKKSHKKTNGKYDQHRSKMSSGKLPC